jgi:hypothetical protein
MNMIDKLMGRSAGAGAGPIQPTIAERQPQGEPCVKLAAPFIVAWFMQKLSGATEFVQVP